jgi:hypothetical protein
MGKQKLANNQMSVDDTDGEVIYTTSYDRHIDILPSSATLGPSAPTPTTTGNARGLGFDADGELAFIEFEVGDDWDGASNMTLQIIWHPESGDAMLDTEQVKWNIAYNSVAQGEAVDNGTEATATTTYTQSGAGTDKEIIETDITIAYTGGNQPLAVGDTVFIAFNRDVTGEGANTYSGLAIVERWEMKFNANKRAYH